ncbi:MAG: ribonuclease D [Anaerolineae bacterium]
MKSQRESKGRQHQPTLPPALIVNDSKSLARLQHELSGARRLAVDTESNSLYAYRERVCLIQISSDRADYLVDPIELEKQSSLDFIGELLADPRVEVVLHAAEYDVMCLRRDFGIELANLFDTMVAARILGWEKVGLADVLQEHFGVTLNKRHQLADWGRRPLPEAMLRYAQMDTHYLLPLRDKMHALLAAGGHLEEARELFDEVCRAEWGRGEFDPMGFWRINGAVRLDGHTAAILQELYLFREQQAQQRDLPVFKILGDATLVAIAERAPASLDELGQIKGMSRGQLRRYGDAILKAVERGRDAPAPKRPRDNGHRPDELTMRRYDLLHTWRKERAAARGVASDVVLSRDTLWELARLAPTTPEQLEQVPSLGPWRRKTYGDEILRVLASAR